MMVNIIKNYALIAAVACTALSGATQATVLFSETFDDNSKGWTEDNNWDVANGVYKFTNPTDFFNQKQSYLNVSGLITASDWSSGSYSVSYDIRFLEPWVGFHAGASWENAVGDQKGCQAESYGLGRNLLYAMHAAGRIDLASLTLPNDAVIVSAGGVLPTPFLQKIGIEVETKYGTA